MAEYTLRFRDIRTLDLLGEMPKYESVEWWRRPVVEGRHNIVVHRQQIAVADIPHLAIFEVLRQNPQGESVFEYAGVVEGREYDAIEQRWTLSGRDLKGFWLATRKINPGASEFDTQAGVAAEDAMKHYVNDHLVAPSDSDRDVNGELDGITFITQGTHGWGATVDKNARWEWLNVVLAELALKGDLLHDVVFQNNHQGYEYQVSQPVDATEGGGGTPVTFSVSLDNVGEAVYTENYRRIVNACYVLGTGTGAARTVREVKDATSIINDLRREGTLDGRGADTNDKLDMAGTVEIQQSLLDALTAHMRPLNVEPTRYRQEWDLGYDVTLDFNVIGVQMDKRIMEVHATLESEEKIEISLGARPMELTRMVGDALRRSNAAKVR